MSTSPGPAACSSRAATLTASPVTSVSPRPGDDLAGVHADADVELDAVAELDRRAHGAQGVVLVQLRNAEDGHHRIADELLDRAAVSLDRGPRGVEVASHHGTRRLRVETLGAGGRARHVAEQHGHGLPLLTRRVARRRGALHTCRRSSRASRFAAPHVGQLVTSGRYPHGRPRPRLGAEANSTEVDSAASLRGIPLHRASHEWRTRIDSRRHGRRRRRSTRATGLGTSYTCPPRPPRHPSSPTRAATSPERSSTRCSRRRAGPGRTTACSPRGSRR